MWERFTQSTKLGIAQAIQGAQARRAYAVESGDLLLGLLGGDSTTSARRILAELGIDLDALEAQVRAQLQPGGAGAEQTLSFSEAAKNALERAVREAGHPENQHIGTDHLLLGLSRGGARELIQLLQAAGLSYRQLRQAQGRIGPKELPSTSSPQDATAGVTSQID